MKRLYIVGRRNSGKTWSIVNLVRVLSGRGVRVGTIKHTHRRHDLVVPGKDSHWHRAARVAVVAFLSPSMTAEFSSNESTNTAKKSRHSTVAPRFESCRLVLIEGDSQTVARKIKVWRSNLGTSPLAASDKSILAVVTDDNLPVTVNALPRSDVAKLSDWILHHLRRDPPRV